MANRFRNINRVTILLQVLPKRARARASKIREAFSNPRQGCERDFIERDPFRSPVSNVRELAESIKILIRLRESDSRAATRETFGFILAARRFLVAGRSLFLSLSLSLSPRDLHVRNRRNPRKANCTKEHRASSVLLYPPRARARARSCLPFARPCAIYEANRFTLFAEPRAAPRRMLIFAIYTAWEPNLHHYPDES